MTHAIDTSFKQKKLARLAERRRKLWRRALAGFATLAVVAVATGFYLTKDYWSFGDEDEELHPVEGMEDVPPDASVYVPAIIDLAGDPMWITLAPDADTATKGKTVARPAELDSSGASPQIEIMSDVMLSASEKFMTTIPSTQEDFAFFQAQRQVAPKPSATAPDDQQPAPPAPAAAPDDQPGDPQGDLQNDLQAAPDDSDAGSAPKADADDPEAGWGETIDQGEAALPAFKKTAIENNTTVATVTSEYQRFEATEDTFVKILNDRSLDSVVLDAHFSADDAKLAGEALKAL
ncbi:MAG: M23 family peptidase, partial [Mesorhizobium sp.]